MYPTKLNINITPTAVNNRLSFSNWYLPKNIETNKTNNAEELGVVAVLEVNLKEDISLGWATNYPFRYNSDYYEGDKPLRSYRSRITLPGDTLKNRLTVIQVSSPV